MTRFQKFHGIGNDFVFLEPPVSPSVALIRGICNRTDGVGSDGLIVVQPTAENQAAMRMWNPDGSESEMCGNGLRCAALYLGRDSPWEIALGGQIYHVEAHGDQFKVKLAPGKVLGVSHADGLPQGIAVNMGNPHLVFFVRGDLSQFLSRGADLECHPDFPNRTNVHFARIDADAITMVTWERGAGPTQACGSGACAVALAAQTQGAQSELLIHLPGGDLRILKTAEGLEMIGQAQFLFEGTWPSDPC